MPAGLPEKRKRFRLNKKDLKRIELLADFLIKFNLLAIPMYIVMLSDIEFYPLQVLLTDIVYGIITSLGYVVVKNGIMLTLVSQTSMAVIAIGIDCTAWKSMYALAALMIASPVANDMKKLRYILLGVSAIFVLNIIRVVTTILVGYWFGMDFLDITHTLFWREGMILAVIAIWFIWLLQAKKQKVIFREKQTILRKLLKKLPNQSKFENIR